MSEAGKVVKGWPVIYITIFFRSAKLIPEDDQIFTEVELNMLEKVINETTVGFVSRAHGCLV